MFLVAAVIIYHPQLSTLGETHLWRFVFEVFLYLVPQVEDDVVCFWAQRMQRIYGLICSGLQRLLLFVGLHKDVVMRGNHPDGGVVNGSSALLNAFFLALDDTLTKLG